VRILEGFPIFERLSKKRPPKRGGLTGTNPDEDGISEVPIP
jgi:hypothetical protein